MDKNKDLVYGRKHVINGKILTLESEPNRKVSSYFY